MRTSIRLQPVVFSDQGWDAETNSVQNNEDGKGIKGLVELATPLARLTEAKVEGDGAFDVLMRSAKAHLKEEFDAQRITGDDYSKVYLGVMQAVMQTSTQFLLNEQQAMQIGAQIGLIRQQTVTELAQTDDTIPQGLGFNLVPKEITPIPSVTG